MSDPEIDPDADKNFRTYIPTWLWTEYYNALGRLMHAFARAEDNLNSLLALYVEKHLSPRKFDTRVPLEGSIWSPENMLASQKEASISLQRAAVLKSVLGGSRFSSLRSTLKRLMRVTNADAEVVREVERIFSQFGEVQFMRDKLAHNAASPNLTDKDCWFCTSNQRTVTENQQWEVIYFKPSMLLSMERDINVGLELLSETLDLFDMKDILANDEAWVSLMSTPEMKALTLDKRGPWHYKPSQLKREGPRWAPNPRVQKHPPQS